MKISFDIRSRMPEGLAEHPGQVAQERVSTDSGDLAGLLHKLVRTLENPLVTGVQITIEEIR